jgi:VIT1/CCC1 family predicted Fe2+/Mn2+ transporter
MGNAFEAILSVIAVMAALGVVGFRISKHQNRNPFIGSALCALIPLVGIGLLLVLGEKARRNGG